MSGHRSRLTPLNPRCNPPSLPRCPTPSGSLASNYVSSNKPFINLKVTPECVCLCLCVEDLLCFASH